MKRSEHIAWVKERALQYVAIGKPTAALASLQSDSNKHPETREHGAIELSLRLQRAGHLSTVDAVKKFIDDIQ